MLLLAPLLLTLGFGNGPKFTKYWPTEADMERDDYVLVKPRAICLYKDQYYLLDQNESSVRIYTLDYRYVRSFSKQGEGPGELISPYDMDVGAQGILAIDASYSFHLFDTQGHFRSKTHVADFIYQMSFLKDQIFAVTVPERSKINYGIYNSDGRRVKGFTQQFSSPQNKQWEDNAITHQIRKGRIYVLQQYGLDYWILDENAAPIDHGRMAYAPYDSPEYKAGNIIWSFKTFDIYRDHWFTPMLGMGQIGMLVLSPKGELVSKATIPLVRKTPFEKDDLIVPADILLVDRNGLKALVPISHPIGMVLEIDLKGIQDSLGSHRPNP